MADRDVIHKAFLDFCRSKPHLQAIGPDLWRLAEVATRAVEETGGPFAAKTFYVAVCDGCGTEDENDEYAAWADKDSALLSAEENSEWQKQDDGRLLCNPCRRKPGGDWYEMAKADGGAAAGWAIDELAPPPVGTQAEAQACAARSGVGAHPDDPTDFDEYRAELKGGNR